MRGRAQSSALVSGRNHPPGRTPAVRPGAPPRSLSGRGIAPDQRLRNNTGRSPSDTSSAGASIRRSLSSPCRRHRPATWRWRAREQRSSCLPVRALKVKWPACRTSRPSRRRAQARVGCEKHRGRDELCYNPVLYGCGRHKELGWKYRLGSGYAPHYRAQDLRHRRRLLILSAVVALLSMRMTRTVDDQLVILDHDYFPAYVALAQANIRSVEKVGLRPPAAPGRLPSGRTTLPNSTTCVSGSQTPARRAMKSSAASTTPSTRFRPATAHLTRRLLRVAVLALVVYAGLIGLTGWQFVRAPTGFIPNQDQGYLITVLQLPPGASLARTTPWSPYRQILAIHREWHTPCSLPGSMARPSRTHPTLVLFSRRSSRSRSAPPGAQRGRDLRPCDLTERNLWPAP